MSSAALEGSPEFVSDIIGMLVARRAIIEATVLSAWQVGKHERLPDADRIAEGAGIVVAALSSLDTPEVRELADFVAARSAFR